MTPENTIAPAMIQFHAATIARQTAEMEAAYEADDRDTGDMIWDAIKFRKQMLAKMGVIIV